MLKVVWRELKCCYLRSLWLSLTVCTPWQGSGLSIEKPVYALIIDPGQTILYTGVNAGDRITCSLFPIFMRGFS